MFMKKGPELHFITVDRCEKTTERYRKLNGALHVWLGRNAYNSFYMWMHEGVHMRVVAHTTSGPRRVRCAPLSLSNFFFEEF